MLGVLRGTDISNARIAGDKLQECVRACEKHEWGKIGDKIGIFPFDEEHNLGPFGYDLCIGDEVSDQRKGQEIRLKSGDCVNVEPGSTVTVLTLEYIILSRTFRGLIQPKARHLIERISQCSVRIGPAWHGKLAIPLTNITNETISFRQGEPFCTMLVSRIDEPASEIITRKDIPFLVRQTLR